MLCYAMLCYAISMLYLCYIYAISMLFLCYLIYILLSSAINVSAKPSRAMNSDISTDPDPS